MKNVSLAPAFPEPHLLLLTVHCMRLLSYLQGDQAAPPDLQLQITSRPRRSLSAAALTWGPVQVEEQSVNTAGGPNASQGRTSQLRYPSPVAGSTSPHRGYPAAPASPDVRIAGH